MTTESEALYIVLNAAKNEGFITDQEADARYAATGKLPRLTGVSVVAESFYEAYVEESGPVPVITIPRSALSTPPAPAAAAVPDGWKLVPVEPTSEMQEAGNSSDYEGLGVSINWSGDDNIATIYRAMLAAAPAAPAVEVVQVDVRKIRKALASGPTEGPWFRNERLNGPFWHISSDHSVGGKAGGQGKQAIALVHGESKRGAAAYAAMFEANADFIAACDPTTVRALLSELDVLRAVTTPQPSASGAQGMESLNEMRLSLVIAIQALASDFENESGALDPESRRAAEASIRHAREVAARWNYNGPFRFDHPAPTAASIYAAIQHGDERHREWLRTALDAVFAGRAVPTCDQTAPTAAQVDLLPHDDILRYVHRVLSADHPTEGDRRRAAADVMRLRQSVRPVSGEDAKDAARYRWLRDNGGDWAVCSWGDDDQAWFRDARPANVVDRAIDAAMSRQESGQ